MPAAVAETPAHWCQQHKKKHLPIGASCIGRNNCPLVPVTAEPEETPIYRSVPGSMKSYMSPQWLPNFPFQMKIEADLRGR